MVQPRSPAARPELVQGQEAGLIAPLVAALEELGAGRLVIVTGAGISAASGIPTFRGSDPDAIWKKDITELRTSALTGRPS